MLVVKFWLTRSDDFVYTMYILQRGKMRAKIQKWGNSLGIRLPKAVTLEAELAEGSEVEIIAEGTNIVIRPSKVKLYQLKDLLANYPKRSKPAKEEDWGKVEGEELW